MTETTVFWISIALLFYTYTAYPALVWLWARLRPQTTGRGSGVPSVTIVVVAFNESQRIRRRIENLLRLDYPPDAFNVVVASDGSTDGTAETARRVRSTRLRVIDFARRRGKPAVLNDVIAKTTAQVVVLADARQQFERRALRILAAHFQDPGVGAVGGELVWRTGIEDSEVGRGVDFYWRYETFIRRNESVIDSSVGATGAIYAIRRELFESIPQDTVLDDVLIPMNIARRGFRVLFDPRAIAYDTPASSAHSEFVRKIRTIGGNFQLLFQQRWLLNPLSNRLWVQTVSHKLCRLLSPLCLISAFFANMAAAETPFYDWLLAGQCTFYSAALVGYLTRRARRRVFLFNVPYAFCLLNVATVVALVRVLAGRQRVTWERTTARG